MGRGRMESYKMYIGGKWVDADSGKTYGIINPATEEVFAQVPLAGESDVNKAIEAARQAFPAWSSKTQAERSKIVKEISLAMKAIIPELVRLDVLEHGTPEKISMQITSFASELCDFAASGSRTLMGHYLPAYPNSVSYLKREPVGVCGIITPWNVPLMMVVAKMAPALAVGNTCVIKPPSINPLAALKFMEVIDKVGLPTGVVNLITGPGSSIGNMISSHPDVDLIAMTGSSETGKAIMAAASQTVKKLVLELGGKNPAIVLEDADLDHAAQVLAHQQFKNTGMTCGSPGRIYVHEKVYDAFVEKFVNRAKMIVVGDPFGANTTMGPVVSAEHRDKVEYYIKSAIEEGARLVFGGKRPTEPPLNKGYYVVPTVFTEVTRQMKIYWEEIFGPVACIVRFSSEQDVMKAANDNRYGLCGSVFTRNVPKGIRMGNQMRVGSFWVNQHNYLATEIPWGGSKESGIGKESGVHGMLEFTELKLMCFELME
jgi:betaine-aldehyde dehydrogenase